MREKTFVCIRCGETFTRLTKSYALYCPYCRRKVNSENTMKSRKLKDPSIRVGVGSGGNQRGANNAQYKGGYLVVYRDSEGASSVCERCGKDKHLVIHHKDEDRSNNERSNLVKVCRSCHAKLHNLFKNITIAEVKPGQNSGRS